MKTVKYCDYCEALQYLQSQFEEDGIHIYDMGTWVLGTPVCLGVQWPSIGTVTPKEAARFGDRLLDAAMAAEEFRYNGYMVKHDP